MINPDEITKAAIWRLSHTPDGQRFVDWLKQCLMEQDKENRTIPVDRVQRGQGKAINMDEIITAFEEAKSKTL